MNKKIEEPLIRCAFFRGYEQLVLELGGDPYSILKELELPLDVLSNEDLCITSRHYNSALELAAKALDCDDFGLRLACLHELDTLGDLALVIPQFSRLDELLEYLPHLVGDMQDQSETLSLTETEDKRTFLSVEHHIPGGMKTIQNAQLSMGFSARMMDLYFIPPPKFDAFYFSFPKPKDLSLFKKIFPAALYFDQEINGASIDSDYLKKKVCIKKLMEKSDIESYFIAKLPKIKTDISSRVKVAILQSLPMGNTSISEVSRILGINKNELQLQLKEKGYNFKTLLNDIKKDEAAKYLDQDRGSLIDLADYLGYSDQAGLTRAFKAWFQQTPSQYKTQIKLAEESY